MTALPFSDRVAAGRLLAVALRPYLLPNMQPNMQPGRIVVLALPRGGVPVAAEVAREFHAPLDLLLVRKIGAPGRPEYAVGAVADGEPPHVVTDAAACRMLGVEQVYIDAEAHKAWREIERRRQCYLQGRAPLPLAGATAVVVDDGMATGTTMRAALGALRRLAPARVLLAVPVASREALAELRGLVDEAVCLATPEPFSAVGCHFREFHQVGDDEVLALMRAFPPSGDVDGAQPRGGQPA